MQGQCSVLYLLFEALFHPSSTKPRNLALKTKLSIFEEGKISRPGDHKLRAAGGTPCK